MAQETRWKGRFAAALMGGAVGIFLAPIVTPALARLLRPATKAAIRAGMAVYQRGLETTAELRETIEDVTAEIQAETAAKAPAADEVAPPAVPAEAATPAPAASAAQSPRPARRAVH